MVVRHGVLGTVRVAWRRVGVAAIACLILLILAPQVADSGQVVPYTEAAYKEVNETLQRMGQPPATGSTTERVWGFIDFCRKGYAAAGYDFDATLRQVVKDALSQRFAHQHPQPIVYTSHLFMLGMLVQDCAKDKMDCAACFSDDVAQAVCVLFPPGSSTRPR